MEVAKPSLFSGKIEKISVFINTAHLYLSMKIIKESKAIKMVWVLSYIQREVTEVWKDNLLDELSKEELEVETVEELFSKIRNKFGKTVEEERKIEQLRTIKQGGRICNEYVQEFKKIARESGYERWPLIEEFKRGLSGVLRRKLAKAESPSSINGRRE